MQELLTFVLSKPYQFTAPTFFYYELQYFIKQPTRTE